jgi:hypothetical protein
MSGDNQDLTRFATIRFNQTLLDGFRLFAKNWFKLILLFGLFTVISIIISDLLVVDLNWQYYQMTPTVEAIYEKDPMSITDTDLNILIQYLMLTYLINLITSISGAMFTALAMSITGIWLYRNYINATSKYKEEVNSSFNKNLLIVLLLFGIIVPLGTLLLFIPSILIMGFYMFLFFTYREKSIANPLKEARLLSRGKFTRIIAIFIITPIIITFINILYQFILGIVWSIDTATYASWYNPATRNYPLIILGDILYQLIGLIFAPLFICLLTPLYTSLKVRKQLGYSFQKGSYAMQQRYAQASQDEQGFFCPFCGFHMPHKLKYCANCGESLDFES